MVSNYHNTPRTQNSQEHLELICRVEANLLGCLLICGATQDNEPINYVRRLVLPEHFMPNYRNGIHKRIYQAMLISPYTDELSVATVMHQSNQLQAKDIAYMVYIKADVLGIDYEHYAKLVIQNSVDFRTLPNFKGGI